MQDWDPLTEAPNGDIRDAQQLERCLWRSVLRQELLIERFKLMGEYSSPLTSLFIFDRGLVSGCHGDPPQLAAVEWEPIARPPSPCNHVHYALEALMGSDKQRHDQVGQVYG